MIFASLMMVGLTFGVGCGPSDEMGEGQQQEQIQAPAQDSTAATRPSDEAGTVRAQVYGCCAWCWNRERYHLVEGVVSSCTDRARDYCGVGDRGGLFDAAWGDCAP